MNRLHFDVKKKKKNYDAYITLALGVKRGDLNNLSKTVSQIP